MKYIFIDIDGTLRGHTQRRMSEVNLEAIKKSREKGNKVFICTGRPINHARDFFDLNVDGFVFSAGAHVQVNKRDIFEKVADLKSVKKVLKVLEDNNIKYQLDARDASYTPYRFIIVVARIRDFFRTIYQGYKWANKPKNILLKKYSDEPIHKVLFYVHSKEKLAKLKRDFPDNVVLVYNSDSTANFFVEVMFDNCTKATGVDIILDYFGGSLKDTVAIGDSMNDLEMVIHCNVGIAMENACGKLKAAADYVTERYDEDGVAKSFEKFNLF